MNMYRSSSAIPMPMANCWSPSKCKGIAAAWWRNAWFVWEAQQAGGVYRLMRVYGNGTPTQPGNNTDQLRGYVLDSASPR